VANRIGTRSTFSSNVLRNPRRNAPPRRTRRPLPRPLSYRLPRSPILSPASPPLPFRLSVATTARFVLCLILLIDGILTLFCISELPIESGAASSIRSSQWCKNASTVSSPRDAWCNSRTLSFLLLRSCSSMRCLRPDGSEQLAYVS
jgi:hypothetical protein